MQHTNNNPRLTLSGFPKRLMMSCSASKQTNRTHCSHREHNTKSREREGERDRKKNTESTNNKIFIIMCIYNVMPTTIALLSPHTNALRCMLLLFCFFRVCRLHWHIRCAVHVYMQCRCHGWKHFNSDTSINIIWILYTRPKHVIIISAYIRYTYDVRMLAGVVHL